MEKDEFRFSVPLRPFEKGGSRRIGGIASLETKDQQGELILQRGLDFTPFINEGWINDNHDGGTGARIGYPDTVKFFQKGDELPSGDIAKAAGHWIEANMVRTKRANEIWELANSLTDAPRKLGFSVEGKIQKRIGKNGKTIAKALVRDVAVTHCPVHRDATLDVLAKSLEAAEEEFGKALGTSHEVPVPTGPQSGDSAGRVISRQSLESDVKNPQTCSCGKPGCKICKKSKTLTKSQVYAWAATHLPQATISQINRLIKITQIQKNAGNNQEANQ